MVYSYMVEALLHPWSGRMDRASEFPPLEPLTIELEPSSDDSIETNYFQSAWDNFDLADTLDEYGYPKSDNPWGDTWATTSINGDEENDPSPLRDSVTAVEHEDSEGNVPIQNLSLDENHCSSSDRETDETTNTLPLRPVLKRSTDYCYENEFFKVDHSKVAGYGAFAVKDLKLGDNILKEFPLFVADSSTVYEQYAKLDAATKRVACSLFASNGKVETPKIKRVWDNNCTRVCVESNLANWHNFALIALAHTSGNDIEKSRNNSITNRKDSFTIGGNMAGLFPIAARFNHACHPANNIDFRYDHEHGYLNMTVRVDKIPAGEELRISYGNDRPPDILYIWYGFRCRCGACNGLSDEEFRRLTDQW